PLEAGRHGHRPAMASRLSFEPPRPPTSRQSSRRFFAETDQQGVGAIGSRDRDGGSSWPGLDRRDPRWRSDCGHGRCNIPALSPLRSEQKEDGEQEAKDRSRHKKKRPPSPKAGNPVASHPHAMGPRDQRQVLPAGSPTSPSSEP